MAKKKSESTGRKIPSRLGCALAILLTGHGWTARELAAEAGIPEATLSTYIRGDTLTRERLDELAAFMDLGPEDVECAVLAARLALPFSSPPLSPVDPSPEDRRTHRRAAALSAGEVFDLVQHHLLADDRKANRRLALEQGRKLADHLKSFSRSEQRLLIDAAPEFQRWSVAWMLCADSEDAAARKPARALELAELALLVARNVQDADQGFRTRLEGWCQGFVGHARLAVGSLPAAEQSLEEARRLWNLGDDPAGLLLEVRLLVLEDSIRLAREQSGQEMKRHGSAQAP